MRSDVPSSEPQPLPTREDFVGKLHRYPGEFDGYFVALHHGRFVGLGVLAGKTYIEGELHNEILGVLPEFRRQGVALGVIVRAIEWARSKGFRYVTAENSATNKAVIPLMELVGFQRQARWQLYRKIKSCTDRIVSISQPHVRAIVRGKSGKNIEFGAKVALSVTISGDPCPGIGHEVLSPIRAT